MHFPKKCGELKTASLAETENNNARMYALALNKHSFTLSFPAVTN